MKLNNQFKLVFIIGLTCIVILGSVIYVERKTIVTINENEPFAALAEQLKNNSVAAHLWFEEAMELDAKIIPQKDVYKYLDSSVQILKSVLDGGETKLGSFKKTSNPETIEIINQLLLNISELKMSAQRLMKYHIQRSDSKNETDEDSELLMNKSKQGGEARALALAFNASYKKVQNNCDKFSLHIKSKFVQDNAMLYRLFWTSIILIIIVFSAFSFLMYRIFKSERLAKDVLVLSENRFRTMFACMDDLIFELDINGTYLMIAPTNPSLLYKPSSHLLGKKLNEVMPEKDAASFLSKIILALKEKKIIHIEYSLPIDNKVFSFEAAVSPLTENSVLWIARDITSRRLAEEEIIKSQISFEDAQKMAKVGSWELNPNTFELKWSKELYRIYELENQPAETLYETCESKFHPDDIRRTKEIINNAVEKGEQFTYEHRVLCGEGIIKEVSCIGEAVKNAEGKLVSMKGTLQDITERKKMENLLKKSEQNTLLLRHAAQVPGAIYQFQFSPEAGFSIPFVSDGIFDLYEITADELMKNSEKVFSNIHPDDLERMMSSIKASMDTLQDWTFDFRVKLPAKGIKWLRGNAKPEKLKDGCFLWHGYFADISESKKMETKLIENQELFSSILQTLPVAVFCKDIKNDFKFSLWNKKAEDIFGLKAEDCIGKTDYDIVSNDLADGFRKNDIEAGKMAGILDIPEETVETLGIRVTVHTQKTIVHDSNGEPQFLLGVSEDITDRKKAEEALQTSKDKLEAVFNGSNDAIMLLTKKGFFDCNVKTLKMFGMSDRKEFIESHPARISPAHQLDGQDSFIKANEMIDIAYDKQFNQFEWIHRRKNGEDFPAEVSLSAFDYGGERVLQATVHDITERKKAENKIKRSLKEKEVLIKEVHHRVKNNLQIILSIINLQYANISDKKTLNLLRDVQSRIKAMSFVHELLYQTNDFSSLNFSEYISKIATSLVYSYTPNRNIKLNLNEGSIFLDLDHAIPCGLIINELLTNSLKYAFPNHEKGEVTISLEQTETFVKLNVSDSGKGFPDNIDYRNTESLGLQLVMTLVQQLGGNITLDNSRGAKYTITFENKKPIHGIFKD